MSTIIQGVNLCTQIRYNFILKHLVRTKLALVMELSICWFGPLFLWKEEVKDTDLYRLYNTNIHEKIEMMKKEKHQ